MQGYSKRFDSFLKILFQLLSIGRVFPLQGSLCYDPISSRVVVTADRPMNDTFKSEEELIPFVPYPLDPQTCQPIKATLPTVERRADLRLGAPIFDVKTGLSVPICAVTIHPTTNQVSPLGK